MPFLRDDEYLLFMDHPTDGGLLLPIDDVKRLRDAGMRTAYFGVSWDLYMPDGKADLAYFYDYLERMHKVDMKCLVSLWHQETMRAPSSWNAKGVNGKPIMGTLSPWNAEAQAANRDILRRIVMTLTSDTVQFVMGQHQGNERVLHNYPAYYDDCALADWRQEHSGEPDHTTPAGKAWLKASYLRLMTDLMEIFVNTRHREVWFSLSRRKAQMTNISCHGCEWIDDYLAAWKAMNPSSINHISFNYFPYGKEYWNMLIASNAQTGVNEIVGAEYCEGLQSGNGLLAAKQGLRGMIIGPCHALTRHRRIETWMVDEIRKNNKFFEARANA